MSRYIDADALKKRVSELIVPDWTRTLIRSWLDSEPTVDAVPVVRCGECRFYKPWNSDGEYGKCKTGLSVMADMFCSCGSRADGDRRSE